MKSEKSCRHEKLMGSQTPSDRIVPDYAYTDGPDAVKVLAVGNNTALLPYQLPRSWSETPLHMHAGHKPQ